MESWDDDNFEPIEVKHTVPPINRWEGEDEDENVKESWEDEEEEQKPVEHESTEEPKTKPKKKSLAEKIAEKERLKREQQKAREQQEEELSPEEILRRQKEADLSLALETTFGDHKTNSVGLDQFNPTTKEEFDEFAEALEKKFTPLAKCAEYPLFAENVVRSLCAPMNSFDIKKIKSTIDNLYLEKQKIEKGDKVKKNKSKVKAKIKVEDENRLTAYVDNFDDYDDFM